MPKKILLVDDEPEVLAICHDYLKVSGYDVVIATDGLQGLAAARREKPDLIVLDLILPEMDGLDVCRAIRRKSIVPIIMLTGRAVISWIDQPSESRLHAENRKVVAAYQLPSDSFGGVSPGRFAGETQWRSDMGRQSRKCLVSALVVEVIRISEVGGDPIALKALELYEAFGFFDAWQRPEECGIDQAEDCGIGAYSQSEREHGEQGDSRSLSQEPNCKPDIL